MPILTDHVGNKKGNQLFTEQELNNVEKMASTGLGITDIAEFLCISDSNFRKHLQVGKTEAENFKGNSKRKNEFVLYIVLTLNGNLKKMHM